MEEIVRSGFVIAWRFATWPTMRSPVFENATTDGVVRAPSELGMTTGLPPSITATHEFVVPRSIPIVFDIFITSSYSVSFDLYLIKVPERTAGIFSAVC